MSDSYKDVRNPEDVKDFKDLTEFMAHICKEFNIVVDFTDLEKRVASTLALNARGNSKFTLQLHYYRQASKRAISMLKYGASASHMIMDEIHDVASKEEAIYREALARNPKTKDLFKSKSTNHSFPWYHRNRKY